ncbi:UNVERIFIED_CONTAM: hypothetical protein GTU68_041196 [Idotea baltica]|nr:hypothetical protein [Idotea baltica]
MLKTGQIDFYSLFNILKQQETFYCGILSLGSTGENLSLSFIEKKKIMNFLNSLKLVVPIIYGLGGLQFKKQLQLIKLINTKIEIQGIMLTTPIYVKPGKESQKRWFSALLNTCNKQCILYNVPSRTGNNLTPELLKDLKKKKFLWGLKEATERVKISNIYKQLNPNIKIYGGEDSLINEFLIQNSIQGIISVLSSLWPKETMQFSVKCQKKNATNHDLNLWKKIAKICFQLTNPILIKKWLYKINSITSTYIRNPLSNNEKPGFNLLCLLNHKIINWGKKN